MPTLRQITITGHPRRRCVVPKIVHSFMGPLRRPRKEGWSDDQIAALVSKSTGRQLDAASIGQHYIEHDDRQA